MAMARVQSPVKGVSTINRKYLKVNGEKFPINNLSGLGNALKKAGYSLSEIKEVYTWVRGRGF